MVSGDVVSCIQLSAVLRRASDGSPGYDSTSNAGGEYKMWVSTEPTFANDSAKTDNFKVREDQAVNPATLRVRKYYDATPTACATTARSSSPAGGSTSRTGPPMTARRRSTWSSSPTPTRSPSSSRCRATG